MKEEDKIIERFGRKGPWSVPDGYFDSVRQNILSELPEYPEAEVPVKLSLWQRSKPYVYLAAMFAGIWCMMQMFHQVSSSSRLNLDNPPENIAMLMSDPEITEMEILPASVLSDNELIDEVSGNYSSMEDFERDFGYSLEPKFDKIDL